MMMEDAPGDIAFFNVSLANGHLMARPRHEPVFSYVGDLMMGVEHAQPEFAWIQFAFRRADYADALRRSKPGLYSFKGEADTPVEKVDGEGYAYAVENPLKRREWYRQVEPRAKAIDAMAVRPLLILEIQGMWAGPKEGLLGLHAFQNCVDENKIDSLRVFTYRDPRMLVRLVRRRLVDDIGWYFARYHGGGRMEPPSFLLTTEELPYFLHFPAGDFAKSVKGIEFKPPPNVSTESEKGEVVVFEGSEVDLKPDTTSGMSLLKIPTFPSLAEDLEDPQAGMLKQLATNSKRTFELIYDEDGRWHGVLGAEGEKEMWAYLRLLRSVYGGLDVAAEDPIPAYARRLVRKLFGAGPERGRSGD